VSIRIRIYKVMNFYYFNYLIDYVYMLILNGFTQMNFIEAG
jgi:hypothetical protein